MMDLCFADCETTGFYVDAGHEVWEWAVIVERASGEIVERSGQLPVDVSKADPQSLAMNGWYDRSVQHKQGEYAWEFSEQGFTHYDESRWMQTWAREFMEVVHGCALIGAVPSFDERFLSKALRKGGGVACWHYQPVDVETLAVGYMIGDMHAAIDEGLRVEPSAISIVDRLRMPPWDSEELSLLLGVDPLRFDRHTALGDVKWAQAIWHTIMDTKGA